MTRKLATTALALALVAPLASSALAQEKPAPPPAQDREGAMVPLKLDLVISRVAGDKKISSLPYTLWMTANAAGRSETSLRMGVKMAVPTAATQGPSGIPVVQSYQYHDIGTNIDASAMSAPGGRYGVSIILNESGVNTKSDSDSAVAGAPMLRNFTSRFFLLLRDGQTATYTSATDPATGETLNVQVTLSVLK